MACEMTPQERAAAIIGGHYECEDPWYSCPLSPEGCANEHVEKTVCTCGYEDRERDVDLLMRDTRRAALLECKETMAGFIEAWLLARMTDKSITPEVHNQVGALANGIRDVLTKLAQEG